ncbi:MAG: hypothetical protein Q8N01_06065 [Sulfuricurvum sp.]|nr:hypothetical protein [Sulfuricurvum sp.]
MTIKNLMILVIFSMVIFMIINYYKIKNETKEERDKREILLNYVGVKDMIEREPNQK